MIQQKEIVNIDSLLSYPNDDVVKVLDHVVNLKERISESDLLLYIIGIHKVIFATDLSDDQKKGILSHLISDLTTSDQNIGRFLFEHVPNTFLFHILISLHNLGVDTEPLLQDVDLNLYENGLTNLQILGDFTDQKFIGTLLVFYKMLDNDRYQKALYNIAIAAAKVNNVGCCENIVKKIKDKENKTKVLISLATLYLKSGETLKAFEIVEKSEDKAILLSNISRYLLKNNRYDEVLNLLKSYDDPVIKFEILLRLIHYHIDKHNLKVIDVLIDQAVEQSRNIDDYFVKAVNSAKLAEVEMTLDRKQEMKIHVSDVLFVIDTHLDFREGCLAFNDLFTRLVIAENYELADDLLTKRWTVMNCTGQIEFDGNHTTEVTHTILLMLLRIDELASEDYGTSQKMEIERLHACALTSLMFLRDILNQDYLLHEIAISYAKHGFYSETIEIRNNIGDKDYKNHLTMAIPMCALGNGDYEKALELACLIEVHRNKVDTQLVLSTVLAKNGFQKEAMDYIRNWAVYQLIKNE